jgi:hypothetical protein
MLARAQCHLVRRAAATAERPGLTSRRLQPMVPRRSGHGPTAPRPHGGSRTGRSSSGVGQIATPVQDDEQFIDQIVGRRALNLVERTRRSPAGPERTTGAVLGVVPPPGVVPGVLPRGVVPPGVVPPGVVVPGVVTAGPLPTASA